MNRVICKMQKIKEVISNFAKSASERLEGKLDGSISNGKCQKFRDFPSHTEEKGRFFRTFDEYNFLICTACFSSLIVFFKLLYAYRDNFRKIYAGGGVPWNFSFSLPNLDFLTPLSAAFASFWSIVVDLNWLFIPAVVGIATTFITWRFVYWDSRIPGVQPPSPFSSSLKFKKPSFMGSNGYTFAMYIGIFVFFTLVVWGVIST